jgi:hypothetical protein
MAREQPQNTVFHQLPLPLLFQTLDAPAGEIEARLEHALYDRLVGASSHPQVCHTRTRHSGTQCNTVAACFCVYCTACLSRQVMACGLLLSNAAAAAAAAVDDAMQFDARATGNAQVQSKESFGAFTDPVLPLRYGIYENVHPQDILAGIMQDGLQLDMVSKCSELAAVAREAATALSSLDNPGGPNMPGASNCTAAAAAAATATAAACGMGMLSLHPIMTF